ncbi:Hypothetical protein NTJ_10576 [Nesidiocoris tenuis]|uniref:Kinesin motor domain-containing protein n=1 Tax=Nesidiocoris tenuis TaxID=355587 RepID=A0ABN7B4T0_9HEMI|nr:Hypothetical protein NTJ_10576 [Nesidiocoris tenuis]
MATPSSTLLMSSNSDGSSFTPSMNVGNVTPSTASYTVYVRIKPLDVLNPSNALSEEHYSVSDTSITTTDSNKKHEMHQNTYKFAKVFLPLASQTEIFATAIEPRLRDFFDSTDVLIFSYGTSSSGKSHTMQGTPSNPGLIPRVLKSIYESVSGRLESDYKLAPYKSTQAVLLSKSDLELIEKQKQCLFDSLTAPAQESGDVTISGIQAADMLASLDDVSILPTCIKDDEVCSLWVSFFEVYNEQVFDLLAFRKGQKLPPLGINMDRDDNSYYPSKLEHLPAASWDEAYNLYRFGKKNLHVSSTLLNRKSSRSHCVFTIKMLIRPKSDEGSYYPTVSFSICDLAGSERMMAHGESKTGSSFQEMKSINNSLLALNKCFLTLKRGNNTVLPPFRDSNLTKLIKKFLVGHGKLVMIATISQSPELLPETQHILKMTAIALTTRVVVKDPAPASQMMVRNTPRRRFSTNYLREPGCKQRPNLPQITEHAQPDSDNSVQLTQQLFQLALEKETLLQEIRTLSEWKSRALDEFTKKQREYDSLMESHNRQQQRITQLEAECGIAEASGTSWYKSILELSKKMSERAREDFEEKVNLQTDLYATRMELKNIILTIKEQFPIDSNDPHQVVQRMLYFVKDMKTAATEEIAEYLEALSKCHAELAAGKETITNLSLKVNQLEEELTLCRQSELEKVETEKIAPIDNTLSDMDENEYCSVRSSRRLRCTTDGVQRLEVPCIPIREMKTSTKKKRRTKRASIKPKDASLESDDQTEVGGPRRNPRRRLLGDIDCLPDDFVSDDRLSPKVQLSPGSAMKTLRSSSRRK